ncbi:MAG: prolyl aminopeptidase [Acidimicrobiaceae bacterium]|nr:prolyl aminopeptidase [Acidimicrobiaceae bacterium]
MLDVGDGHRLAWEGSGARDGKPAVLLHGGPGSGSSPRHRRLFDPDRYLIVQFDQRMCGRSTPSASEPVVDLSTNTTPDLIADIERLRRHLDIDAWLVWGGSWGTTLGLAYAQGHPHAVTELVLGSVVTTTRAEVEWVTRAMGRIFPERWRTFVEHLPPGRRDGDLAAAYHELLIDPDPAVHQPAADAWCEWEDTHVSLLGGWRADLSAADPAVRLGFARLVTHYWSNAGFVPDGALVDGASRLAGIPTFLAHGRADISAPADVPVELARRIEGAQLHIAEHDGHGGNDLSTWMSSTLDHLA